MLIFYFIMIERFKNCALYNTNPISRRRPRSHGNLSILTNWSLVSHYRSWPSSNKRGVTGKWEKTQHHKIRISSSWSCNVWNNVVLSLTFLRGEEVRLSTGLPRYQSGDDLWSYSFPLEEWSSQWSDFWEKYEETSDTIETTRRGALSFL